MVPVYLGVAIIVGVVAFTFYAYYIRSGRKESQNVAYWGMFMLTVVGFATMAYWPAVVARNPYTGLILIAYLFGTSPAPLLLFEILKPKDEEPSPKPEPIEHKEHDLKALTEALTVPPSFVQPVIDVFMKHNSPFSILMPDRAANEVNILFNFIPPGFDVEYQKEGGIALGAWLGEHKPEYLASFIYDDMKKLGVRLVVPEALRTEHMMVVAGSGHGKTQLFQSSILDDMEKDATVIVIDSQSQLINNLLHVVPSDRLVHISPTDKAYPLALNLFDKDQDATLYEYIFSALDQQLTSGQATVYRFVSRLVAEAGGTLDTMREILEKGGLAKYRQYVDTLPPIAQSFFATEYDTNRQYIESRQAILRRIYSLLENDTFAAMFTSRENKVNLEREIYQKKVILIDTAKSVLTGATFKVFGRFFIAQIARAIFNRSQPYPHRVYIYIDEAQEYFSDEDLLVELFTQARKYNVGITIAFQYLGQLPDKVARAVMANTAIKLAGGVSAADRAALAREMNCEQEFIQTRNKGNFATAMKGRPFTTLSAPFGRLENMPKRSPQELDALRETTRQRYCLPKASVVRSVPTMDDPDDVEEASEWKP